MTNPTNQASPSADAESGISLNFECAPQCGGCCRDLRLPLTVHEAIGWLERGGKVELLCEAIPWQSEPEPDQLVAAHKRRRSFPAASGALPIRVIVVIAARFEGGCPNLLEDMRCGIYHERPLVCRIYPAEINPFIVLQPEHKMCPSSAWQSQQPLLRGGRIVDEQIWSDIQRSRDADQREAPLKARVCTELGIDIAAFSTLGFAVHHPEPAALLAALRKVAPSDNAADSVTLQPFSAASADAGAGAGSADVQAPLPEWRFSNDRQDLVEALVSVGATIADDHASSAGGARWERLSLG